ncbi:MAG: MSCRAMM family adhesin SdrC [Gemmatimonadetes bacterium]|nr:MSCRAMM family adhesin SdrC [Gemmatimonadota bacterium]
MTSLRTTLQWRGLLAVAATALLAACAESPAPVSAPDDARLGIVPPGNCLLYQPSFPNCTNNGTVPGNNALAVELLEVCKVWGGGVAATPIQVRLQVRGGTTKDTVFTIAPGDGKDAQGNPVQCKELWFNGSNTPADYATVTEVSPSSGYAVTWTAQTRYRPGPAGTAPVNGPVVNGTGATSPEFTLGGPTIDGALITFTNTPLGSIGDRVWNDVNGDGVQDGGEAGLTGWTVTLSGPVNASTTTGTNGTYSFPNLPAGDYTVCVAPASGYVQTYDLDGIATANCSAQTLGVGQNRTDVDFGYRQPPVVLSGSIGNYAWIDSNGNGKQDVGEPALDGVVVTLSGTASGTQTTSGGGQYLFTGLGAGSYTVTATAPAGYTFTTTNAAGTTNANDSNGATSSVTLATNSSSDLTIDFGFVPVAGGGQGCTPGYWKQSQHFDSWKGYTQTDMVDAVFGVTFRSTHKQNPKGALSLLDALGLNGNGGGEQLFRHGTAALLNAVANSGVSYPYTAAQVISMVRTAWLSGNATTISNTHKLLGDANEAGCPLN